MAVSYSKLERKAAEEGDLVLCTVELRPATKAAEKGLGSYGFLRDDPISPAKARRLEAAVRAVLDEPEPAAG